MRAMDIIRTICQVRIDVISIISRLHPSRSGLVAENIFPGKHLAMHQERGKKPGRVDSAKNLARFVRKYIPKRVLPKVLNDPKCIDFTNYCMAISLRLGLYGRCLVGGFRFGCVLDRTSTQHLKRRMRIRGAHRPDSDRVPVA